MNIGKAIAYYREKLGLTGTQLADKSGVTQGAISQYENGKKNPTQETIEKLASALGVTPEELHRKAQAYPDVDTVCESRTGYNTRSSDMHFIRRNNHALVKLSPSVLLGARFRVYELTDESEIKPRPRIGGVLPSSPLESVISKVFAEFIEFHSDEISYRISEELRNLETSVEEIVRNLRD